VLAALLTTVLFAFSAISGRRLAHYLRGTQANLTRLLFAAALTGVWSHWFGFGLHGAACPVLFLSGCVGFGVGDLALFQAYPRLGSRRTMVLVQCLAAPFAALAEWLWLGHIPSPAQGGFGVLILVGVGAALMPRRAEMQPIRGLAVGTLFGILAALGQGGGAVLSRKAYAVAAASGEPFHGVGDGINAAYQRLIGGIVVSALFFLYLRIAHTPDPTRKSDWPGAWPWVVANALTGPSLGVACFQWALITSPTNIVLPIVATTPLAVIPLAHWLEGDRITRRAVLGGAIAVAGVIGLTLAQ
jgi:drug/metabolite transporter (DMT)-like permease